MDFAPIAIFATLAYFFTSFLTRILPVNLTAYQKQVLAVVGGCLAVFLCAAADITAETLEVNKRAIGDWNLFSQIVIGIISAAPTAVFADTLKAIDEKRNSAVVSETAK